MPRSIRTMRCLRKSNSFSRISLDKCNKRKHGNRSAGSSIDARMRRCAMLSILLAFVCSSEGWGGVVVHSMPDVIQVLRRTQTDDQPPEENVSPAPTKARSVSPSDFPSFSPTPHPTITKTPTRRPTPKPTVDSTASPATTQVPTKERTVLPSITPPFFLVTPIPSERPSQVPRTRQPSTRPTNGPTVTPTRRPTSRPTLRPTDAPTRVPSLLPSMYPSIVETQNDPSQPTENATVKNVSIPIDFTATIESEQDPDVLASIVAPLWKSWMTERFQKELANLSWNVSVLPVTLDVVPVSSRRRILQQSSIKLRANGTADFAVNSTTVDPNAFSQQANTLVQSSVTPENLQQPLNQIDSSSQIVAIENDQTDLDTINSNPTVIKIVIGFTLLALALASLVYWGRVIWHKRKKEERNRRLAALRKSAITYQPGANTNINNTMNSSRRPTSQKRPPLPPIIASRTTTTTTMSTRPPVGNDKDDRSVSSSESSGIYDGISESDNSEAISDAFGRELKKAVSADRAAWEEFQRKKREIEQQGRLMASRSLNSASISRTSSNVTSATSAAGVAAVANVAMYNTPGSQDQGVEVEAKNEKNLGIGALGSFPYGDEEVLSSSKSASWNQKDVELNSDDAVPWTSSGITLKVLGKRDDQWSPYGDRAVGRKVDESWQLESSPIPKTEGQSQFSFMYPLKRQPSPQNSDLQSSPTVSEDRTSVAVRVSPTVSSWGTTGNPGRASPRSEYSRDLPSSSSGSSEDDSSAFSQSVLTASMIKEVEKIADYVKRLGKNKEERDLSEMRRTQKFEALVESTLLRGVQYNAMSDSVSGRQSPEKQPPLQRQLIDEGDDEISSDRKTYASPDSASGLPSSTDAVNPSAKRWNKDVSKDHSYSAMEGDSLITTNSYDTEDDTSQRLGINRYSVQKPAAPQLSFKAADEPITPDQTGKKASVHEPDRSPTHADLKPDPPKRLANHLQRDVVNAVSKESSMQPSDSEHMPTDEETIEAKTEILSNSPSAGGHADKNIGTSQAKKRSIGVANGTQNAAGHSSTPDDDGQQQVANDTATSSNGTSSKKFRATPPRSKSSKFNNIISLFESKPKTAVVPPNDNWQFNS